MRARRGPRGWALALALATLAGPAWADATRLKTGRGTFLVEVAGADVSAKADGDDLVIAGPGDAETRLRPDPEPAAGAATGRDPILTVRRGGKVVATVRRVGPRVAAPVGPVADGDGRTILGEGRLQGCWSLAVAADGGMMASGHEGSIQLWDLATLNIRRSVQTDRTVRRVALTPDGRTIASAEYRFIKGEATGGLVIRDGDTGAVRVRGKESTIGMHGVAINPDGKVAVTSAWTQYELKVWDAEKGDEVGLLRGHNGVAATLEFSPDGKTLASAGDTSVRFWDVEDGTTRRTFKGHTKTVESMAWSRDGKTIASGGFDETARAWDAGSGKLLATFECDDPVLAVAITPDGKTLASASARWGNGFYDASPAQVRLWDVATGKLKAKLPDQPRQIFSMVITPDGKTLITASLSGALIAWDLEAWPPAPAADGVCP